MNVLFSSHASNSSLISAESTLIETLTSLLPNTTFAVNGKPMTSAGLNTLVQSHIAALQKTAAMRAALNDQIALQDDLRKQVQAAVLGLRDYVFSTFGRISSQASALGFQPKKRAVISGAVRVAATVKAKLTREARGTKGKKQRLAIKATPPAPAPAPTTTGNTPNGTAGH